MLSHPKREGTREVAELRDRVSVPVGLGDDQLKEAALATEGAQRFTEGLAIRKVVVVPGRLVKIVAG